MIDSILVSYSYNTKTGNALMCVGKKKPNETVEVINAFAGEEATDLWNRLTKKKERANKGDTTLAGCVLQSYGDAEKERKNDTDK